MRRILALVLSGIVLVLFVACSSVPSGGRVIGGEPITINELPTYPGATELNASESQVIEPLFGPAQRETPPFIGLGIEVVKTQRNFRVPSDTTFEMVKSFYADKLQAAGWREDAAMRVFTDNANANSKNLQGAIWVRVDQTLLIAMASNASGEKEVTLSLATH
jgi:hypothetical protein